MEIKPRIIWGKYIKKYICFLSKDDRVYRVGVGKTIQEAYDDWKVKQNFEPPHVKKRQTNG